MRCSYCQAPVENDSKYCSSCGAKQKDIYAYNLQTNNQKGLPCIPRPGLREPSPANSKQQGLKGSSNYYYNKANHLNGAVRALERFLCSNNMVTQIVEDGNEKILQGKMKPNLFKKVAGLDHAVTICFVREGNDVRVTIGGAKWLDKAKGVIVGWFFFAPVFVSSGWGIYKQQQLFKRVRKELDGYFLSQ